MFPINHVWLWKDYRRMNEPHYCTRCLVQLEKKRRAEVVPPGSDLWCRLYRDYSMTEHRWGKTKYHWTEFFCPSCGRWYCIDEIRTLEEENNGK